MNNAVRLALLNYSNFRGRTKRQDFWLWYLFTVLLTIPTSVLDRVLFSGHTYIQNLATIFIIVPSISAGTRRLHDVGKRGWWLIAPFANLFFLVQPSGPMNQFEI
jgi:uncharacterized membrane protein YhaH (DUF805 family)